MIKIIGSFFTVSFWNVMEQFVRAHNQQKKYILSTLDMCVGLLIHIHWYNIHSQETVIWLLNILYLLGCAFTYAKIVYRIVGC